MGLLYIYLLLKTELNAKNKITATAALVVPVLGYSFDIMSWKFVEI
jgi:hypothetical protein